MCTRVLRSIYLKGTGTLVLVSGWRPKSVSSVRSVWWTSKQHHRLDRLGTLGMRKFWGPYYCQHDVSPTPHRRSPTDDDDDFSYRY